MLTRRKFFFGAAAAAVATPAMALLPELRRERGDADKVELWAGGTTWVDAEYDEKLGEVIHLETFLEKRDRIRAEFERCKRQGLLPPSWSDLGRIAREV